MYICIYTYIYIHTCICVMQLEDVLGCLISADEDEASDGGGGGEDASVESFYEVAKWLTVMFIRFGAFGKSNVLLRLAIWLQGDRYTNS